MPNLPAFTQPSKALKTSTMRCMVKIKRNFIFQRRISGDNKCKPAIPPFWMLDRCLVCIAVGKKRAHGLTQAQTVEMSAVFLTENEFVIESAGNFTIHKKILNGVRTRKGRIIFVRYEVSTTEWYGAVQPISNSGRTRQWAPWRRYERTNSLAKLRNQNFHRRMGNCQIKLARKKRKTFNQSDYDCAVTWK